MKVPIIGTDKAGMRIHAEVHKTADQVVMTTGKSVQTTDHSIAQKEEKNLSIVRKEVREPFLVATEDQKDKNAVLIEMIVASTETKTEAKDLSIVKEEAIETLIAKTTTSKETNIEPKAKDNAVQE